MNSSKRVQQVLIMAVLWTGAGQVLPNTPLAGERGGDRIIRPRGVLEPAGYEDIRSQAPIPLSIVSIVPEGSLVKKGDLLVELDAAGLIDGLGQQQVRALVASTQRAEAEAALAAAKEDAAAALQLAEQSLALAEGEQRMFVEGDYPFQVGNAESEIPLAEIRLAIATERLERVREQVKEQEDKGPLAEAELAVAQAKAAASAATNRLRFLTKMLYPQRTAALKLTVAQREMEVARARREVGRSEQRAKAALAVAQAGDRAESARLERLQQQTSASRIHASRDGTVFYPPDAARDRTAGPRIGPGTVVREHQTLVRLADLTQLKIEIPLSTPIATRIPPRQPVTINVHAFPERTYRGHVQSVASASRDPGRPDERWVTFRLDNPARELMPGMAATVELELPDKSTAPDAGR